MIASDWIGRSNLIWLGQWSDNPETTVLTTSLARQFSWILHGYPAFNGELDIMAAYTYKIPATLRGNDQQHIMKRLVSRDLTASFV